MSVFAADRNDLLARGIPALSGPTGGRDISTLPMDRNVNMNDNVFRSNGWGRNHAEFGAKWMHGDLKDMAFFYNYPLFMDIVTKGGLK